MDIVEYSLDHFNESVKAWKKLGIEFGIGETHAAWYYYSVLTTECGIRGSAIMLFKIAQEHQLFKTFDEKVDVLAKLFADIPLAVAIDVIRSVDYNRKKLEQAADTKSALYNIFIKALHEKHGDVFATVLEAYARSMAQSAAIEIEQKIKELNEIHEVKTQDERKILINPEEVEQVVIAALFKRIIEAKE